MIYAAKQPFDEGKGKKTIFIWTCSGMGRGGFTIKEDRLLPIAAMKCFLAMTLQGDDYPYESPCPCEDDSDDI